MTEWQIVLADQQMALLLIKYGCDMFIHILEGRVKE